jgi:M6 family metalloprotease-like protein
MIKRFLFSAVLALLLATNFHTAFAVKAYPYPVVITQPDGAKLKVLLKGNENFHYMTTEDGYLLKTNRSSGFISYAKLNERGEIVVSNLIARDKSYRTTAEISFIENINKVEVLEKAERLYMESNTPVLNKKSAVYNQPIGSALRTGSPKSLVILVNFSDKSFSTSFPQESFKNLLNEENYSQNGGTGSASDYFQASSYGIFSPSFDVVGPYTLPQALDYYGSDQDGFIDQNVRQMVIDACNLASTDGVDFSEYDTDNDGVVDNVFIYYAGYNQAEGGSENTIWPHSWHLSDLTTTFNGKSIYTYACTSELNGNSGSNMCGIGTFCHEFSHVLGLKDYYNTSDSDLPTLGYWSLMDIGNYSNEGRTPPSFSSYDRFSMGWLSPEQLTGSGGLANFLHPLKQGSDEFSTKQSYILSKEGHNVSSTNPLPSEFFMLEYRKKKGWDKYLPEAGLCIWHIDYDQSAWDNNTVNAYTGPVLTPADHMRVYLKAQVPQPIDCDTVTPGTAFNTGSFVPVKWDGSEIFKLISGIDKSPGRDSLLFTFHAGNSSNFKLVKVSEPGTLSDLISESQKTDLTILVLKGFIDARDIKFVRDNMPNIETIDLSLAHIVSYKGDEGTKPGYNNYPENMLPDFAFKNLGLITITLPPSVVSIGMEAFANTRLSGTLEIDNVLAVGRRAYANCGNLTKLILDDDIEYIHSQAFANCSGLKGVLSLPKELKELGDHAFYNCTGFSKLIINDSLHIIGDFAFYNCSGLKGSLEFPDSLKSIGGYAFYFCSGLTGDLTLPPSIKEANLGSSAFEGCTGFNGSLTLPDDLSVISSALFYDCSGFIGNLKIPNSIESIGSLAFGYCTGFDGSLELNNGLISIGSHAFVNCYNFDGDLNLPSSLTTIKSSAFYRCKGFSGSLAIPGSVSQIGVGAFYQCSGFDGNLSFGEGVTSIGDGAFSFCHGFTGDLEIPSSVLVIGDLAFQACSGFDGQLTLGSSLKNIGFKAFFNCYNFEGDLNIPNSVEEIGEYTFFNCYNMTGNLTLSSSLVNIPEGLFYNCKFTGGLSLPDGLNKIGKYAFYECSEFSAGLNIPDGVVSIGEFAFYNNKGFYGNLRLPYNLTKIEEGVFFNCFRFQGDLILPNGLKKIEKSAFAFCSGFNRILSFPNGLESIGEAAFYECSGFTSFNLPMSLKSIGKGAFYNNKGLTGKLQIPTHIDFQKINDYTFAYCSGLTDISIPNNVTSIGKYAFFSCAGLNQPLSLPANITSIKDYTFSFCSNLTGDLVIPNQVTSIGTKAFANCLALDGTLTLGDNLENVGKGSFAFCENLSGVSFGRNVHSISDSAFFNCSSIKTILSHSLNGTPKEAPGTDIIMPPDIRNSSFIGVKSTTPVYVKNSEENDSTTVARYKEKWDYFTNIYPFGFHSSRISSKFFSALPGSISNIEQFSVSGDILTSAIIITAPNNYELSLSNGESFSPNESLTIEPKKGVVSSKNIFVRLKSNLPVGSYPGTINITTSNFDPHFIEISGVVRAIPSAIQVINPGTLGSFLTPAEKNIITTLKVSGNIDARDIRCLRDSFPSLSILDLEDVTIHEYSGSEGTGYGEEFVFPENEMPSFSFYNNGTGLAKTSLTSIILPTSITSIGRNAFFHCSGISGSLSLPASLIKIDNNAFYSCTGLSGSLFVPDKIEHIGNSAFSYCTGLNGILSLGESVQYIGEEAFSGCHQITGNLILPDLCHFIGSSAFSGCSGFDGYLSLPSEITSINDAAFLNCSGVKAIISLNNIPPSVSSNTFRGINTTAPVYVIDNFAIDSYSAAQYWNNFSSFYQNGLYSSSLNSDFFIYTTGQGPSNSEIITVGGSQLTGDIFITSTSDFEISTIGGISFTPMSPIVLTQIAGQVEPQTIFVRLKSGLDTGNYPAVLEISSDGYSAHNISLNGIVRNIPTAIDVDSEGTLKDLFLLSERSEIRTLAVTGNIDARDFQFMRDSLPNLEDLDLTNAKIADYSGIFGPVFGTIVNYPANEIPQQAFYNITEDNGKSSLKSIKLPTSLTSIGANSFLQCANLKCLADGLVIPDGVNYIGDQAFRECTSLEQLSLGSSLYSIGVAAFYDCTNLQGSLILPASLSNIGHHAFYHCYSFTGSLLIPGYVRDIPDYTFYNCYGFTGSLTISNSVTSIGVSAFEYCEGFTDSLKLSESLVSIGSGAFGSCGFSGDLTIPDSVTSIGRDAFDDCVNLGNILTLGQSVSYIGEHAFRGCNIQSIVSLNPIPPNKVNSFYTSVNSVPLYVRDSAAYKDSDEWRSFSKISNFGVYTSNKNLYFSYRPNNGPSLIESFSIRGGFLGDDITLSCSSNFEISFSTDELFQDTNPLILNPQKSVVHPTDIFVRLKSGLENGIYKDSIEISSIGTTTQFVYIDGYVRNPPNLIDVESPGTLDELLTVIEKESIDTLKITGFIDARDIKFLRNEMTSLTHLDISDVSIMAYEGPDGPVGYSMAYPEDQLPRSSFQDNDNLISVKLPGSIRSIGAYAFRSCTNLANISMSDSISEIGTQTFRECSKLDSVFLPAILTLIDENTFQDCLNLSTVIFPDSLIEIDNSAFLNCTSLNNFILPGSLKLIRSYAFKNCSSIEEISLPASLTSIGIETFKDCIGIKRIYALNPTPPSIYSTTFLNIPDTIALFVPDLASIVSYAEADYWSYFVNIYSSGILLSKTELNLFTYTPGNGPSGIDSFFISGGFLSGNILLSVAENFEISTNIEALNDGLNIVTLESVDNVVNEHTIYVRMKSGLPASNYEDTLLCESTGYPTLKIPLNGLVRALPDSVYVAEPGSLGALISQDEKSTITQLTLSGMIDARDIKCLRDEFPMLEVIDMSDAEIQTYTGAGGTKEGDHTYEANVLPANSFYSELTETAKDNITSIKLPLTLVSFANSSLNYCSGLTEITIPGNVVSLNSSIGFNFCGNIRIIEYLGEIPPEDSQATFSLLGNNTRIYVPSAAAADTFKNHDHWKRFSIIAPGINTMVSSLGLFSYIPGAGPSNLENFTINGRSLTNEVIINSTENYELYTYSGSLVLHGNRITLTAVEGVLPDTTILVRLKAGLSANPNYSGLISIESDGYSTKEIALNGKVGLLTLDLVEVTTPGTLNTMLTDGQKDTLTSITLTGNIDARDFRFLRDSMPELAVLDLSLAQIEAYEGTEGTYLYESKYYPENEIPQYSFYEYYSELSKTSLTFVRLPMSTSSIGDYAFKGCTEITNSLQIPTSVTRIGKYAFAYAGFTGSLIIPNSVRNIEEGAFRVCRGFTGNLGLHDSLISIGISAFEWCSGITGALVIPNSIDTISKNAFANCSGFSGSLILPSGLKEIDDQGFYNSSFTGTLNIPDSVSRIGERAFGNCDGFSGDLILPNLITHISRSSFSNCIGFNSILSLPESLTYIGDYAFSSCSGLTGIQTYGNSLEYIGHSAFEACSGLSGDLTIPNSVDSIGNAAFARCYGLTNVVLPQSLSYLGEFAFLHCKGLKTIDLPNVLITIEESTFERCELLTKIELPENLVSIHDDAFKGCKGIRSPIIFPSTFQYLAYTSLEECPNIPFFVGRSRGPFSEIQALIAGAPNKSALIYVPDQEDWCGSPKCYYKGIFSNVHIDVENYGEIKVKDTRNKFISAPGVETTIEDVFTIDGEVFSSIQIDYNSTYYDLYLLTGVDFTKVCNLTVLHPDGSVSCDGQEFGPSRAKAQDNSSDPMDEKSTLQSSNVSTIHANFYAKLKSGLPLGEYDLSISVKRIGLPPELIELKGIIRTTPEHIDVSIPGSLGSLLSEAEKTAVTKLTITGQIDARDIRVIRDSLINLTEIDLSNANILPYSGKQGTNGNNYTIYPGDELPYKSFYHSQQSRFTSIILPESLTSIGSYSLSNCKEVNSMILPNSLVNIGDYAFSNCSGITGNLNLSDSLITIGDYAFSNCLGFNGALVIPPSLTSIGESAFSNTGFTGDLIIPDSVTYLGESAFYSCKGFDGSLSIGNSITSINSSTFRDCGFTNSLRLPDSLNTIGSNAFRDCDFTGSLTLPSSLSTIESYAFYNCSGLTGNLVIPDAVLSIGGSAFSNCVGFADSLIISSSVEEIGNYAFSDCNGFNLILSKSIMPPTSSAKTFNNISANTPVWVPLISSVGFYKISPGWSNFSNIYTSNFAISVNDFNFFSYKPSNGPSTIQDFIISGGSLSENLSISVPESYEVSLQTGLSFSGGNSIILSPIDGILAETKIYIRLKAGLSQGDYNGDLVVNSIGYSDQHIPLNGAVRETPSEIDIVTPGTLSLFLTSEEKASITSLSITGNIDARDIRILRDSLIQLSTLDLSGCTIFACQTSDGPISGLSTIYPQNEMPQQSFYDNILSKGKTSLDSIVLPHSLVSIGSMAFRACSSIQEISLPGAITSISDNIVFNCTGLELIRILSETPPEISSSTFSGIDTSVPIFVPNALSYIAYKAAAIWKDLPIYPYGIASSESTLSGFIYAPGSNISIQKSLEVIGGSLTGDISITAPTHFEISLNSGDSFIPEETIIISQLNDFVHSTIYIRLKTGLSTNSYEELLTMKTDGYAMHHVELIGEVRATPNSVFVSEPGTLSYLLSSDEKDIVDKLIITGNIDARDIKCLRDEMPALTYLDISSVNIKAYSGDKGTLSEHDIYPENEMPKYSFFNKDTNKGKELLTTCLLPTSVTSIGDYAFKYCSGLSGDLNLPSGITTLGANAFYACEGLTGSLTLPLSLTTIGESAFSNTGFTGDLIIPNSVTFIGEEAFYSCEGFDGKLSIGNSVTSIARYTFMNCYFSGVLVIPPSVTSIGDHAFRNSSGKIKAIVTTRLTPATINGEGFYGFDANIPIYVVNNESINAYKADADWNLFTNYRLLELSVLGQTLGAFVYAPDKGPSPQQSMDISAGLSENDLTINADEHFELSLESNSFNGLNSIILPAQPEGGLMLRVYIRLKAGLSQADYSGNLMVQTDINSSLTIPLIGAVRNLPDTIYIETPGTLSQLLSANEKLSILDLTVIGEIDARDIACLHFDLPVLSNLDLSQANINAYTGTDAFSNETGNRDGTLSVFPENEMPAYSFCCYYSYNNRYEGKTSLLSVKLPQSISKIGENAFRECTGLNSLLILPGTLKFIDTYAFRSCSGISAFVSLNPFPIKTQSSAFMSISVNTPVYVTTNQAIDAYSIATGWKSFKDFRLLKLSTIGTPLSTFIQVIPNNGPVDEKSFKVISNLTEGDINISASSNFEISLTSQASFIASQNLTLPSIKDDLTYKTIFVRMKSGLALGDYLDSLIITKSGSASVIVPLIGSVRNVTQAIHLETPGTLATLLSPFEKANISILSVSGTIDARDVRCLRDEMPKLANLDLYAAFIAAYSGYSGTFQNYNISYPENEMPEYSFYNPMLDEGKTSLVSIKLPGSITSIGEYAFADCYFMAGKLSIGKLVTGIEDGAFQYCVSIDTIESLNPSPPFITNSTFYGFDMATPVYLPSQQAIDDYKIAYGWKDFFTDFRSYEGIDLQDTIRDITPGNLSSLLSSSQKKLITHLTITGDIDARDVKCLRDEMTALIFLDISLVNIVAYEGESGTMNEHALYPENQMPVYSFYNDELDLPKTLLEGCQLPLSITSIGDFAFNRCSALSNNFSLPISVKQIGEHAFSSCTNLQGVLELPENLEYIGSNAFMNCKFEGDLIIPASVTAIGDHAFDNCMSFDGQLSIGNAVTSIGNYAFMKCKFTGELIIPGSVISIGNGAFSECDGFFGSLRIGESVSNIGIEAFNECKGFDTIYSLNPSPPKATNSTFNGFDWSIPVYVPSLQSLNEYKIAIGWRDFFNSHVVDIHNFINANQVKIYISKSNIVIEGSQKGELVKIYNLLGKLIYTQKSIGERISVPISNFNMLYIVNVGNKSVKIKPEG